MFSFALIHLSDIIGSRNEYHPCSSWLYRLLGFVFALTIQLFCCNVVDIDVISIIVKNISSNASLI
jgi:hypothetical protein